MGGKSRGGWSKRSGFAQKRPADLKGKEIGLYYKNLYKQQRRTKNAITLRIPGSILSALHGNIKSIREIAQKENIPLSPVRKLSFNNPVPVCANVNIDSPDEPPPKLNIQDQPLHVKSETMVIENEPNDNENVAVKYESLDYKTPLPDVKSEPVMVKTELTCIKVEPNDNETAIISEKEESVKPNSISLVETDDDNLLEINGKPKTASEESEENTNKIEYSVSNNYVPSTSKANWAAGKSDYKYGYEDIISGTFEEKLDECLAKGIEINKKNEDINKLNEYLVNEYMAMIEDPMYKKMREFREKLPTFNKTQELLNVINNNQVVVISGETGCGKSTQVPQIILDDAILNGHGANLKVLVTQPRRIAASSLAMRVADERAEKMGNTVGYAVRLERVDCRTRGSIMFCTTGVLLVELEVNQSLSNYSHIILDEVHERDCQIDIAMCMLRQVLKKRKDLKLILMSATIDADKLSAYYNDCPMLHIEGLAYPVKDVYLEEILQMVRYSLPPRKENSQTNRPMKPWMKHVKRFHHSKESRQMETDIKYKAEIAPWLESIKSGLPQDVYQTLQDSRIEQLDMDLIVELLIHISSGDPGAILVFLPGIGEISKLMRVMQERMQFPENLYEIHPLHSKLPTLTQHKIFKRPPGNIRKIIIATNIAETSITIDDIVYVVDCGKLKYKGLNVEDNVSTLQIQWVSQANMRQRRGRAGRCQPGICYHLLTSFRVSKLEERLLPELQRSDLLEPVLQIKRLRLGLAEPALNMMPEVPDEKTIKNAVRHLQQCGALDNRESLTPLGWHLARLPVHPAAGKLLLLGALFGCLDRAASVAAVWGFKDPFHLVIGKEMEVDNIKKDFALGEPSDHIAISEAIIRWEACGYESERKAFAYRHFLAHNTLQLLSDMKRQFGDNLKQMGFLPSGDVKAFTANRNSHNLSLFKAIIAASLYPNTATVRWSNSRNPRKLKTIRVRTPDGSVGVHPSSVMAVRYDRRQPQRPLCDNPGANWLVYWLKQKSTDLFLLEVTLVYTLPLLFFGELSVSTADRSHECLITINSIKVCCDREAAQLLFDLRALLDKVLATKIMINAGEAKGSNTFEQHVLNAVIKLITEEDEGTEYFDDMSESDTDTDFTHNSQWR